MMLPKHLKHSLAALLTVFTTSAQADLVLTMGGDVNFSKTREAPRRDGVPINGRVIPFEAMTANIVNLLDGDLNFANIETAISARADLQPIVKSKDPSRPGYHFVGHPNGVRHLMDVGFDLFALANNHTYDYGLHGLVETRAALDSFKNENPTIGYAGVGLNRADAARPMVIERNGYTIAFAAIGIMDARFRATADSPGMLNYRDESDYALQLKALRETSAHLKILSVHFGTEKQLRLDKGQRERFIRALREGDADIVIGHHPHVVRPIEMVDGKLIIYSLGNYMMRGAANIDQRPPGLDFGLFARVYFGLDSGTGRLKAQAAEVVPLKGVHFNPRPLNAQEAAWRIGFLNSLSANQAPQTMVRFEARPDSTGIFCADDIHTWTARAARVCRERRDVVGIPQGALFNAKTMR